MSSDAIDTRKTGEAFVATTTTISGKELDRYFCSYDCAKAASDVTAYIRPKAGVLSDIKCHLCGLRAAKIWPQWVNAYDHNRAYGGPEEGGWWYDTGEILASIPCFNDEQVTEAKVRLENWLKPQFEGNHDIGSVLCEGKLQICVEDEPGKSYPETRPHYE